MEINYELILKYLNTNSDKETFNNKKNLIKFSEGFPKDFKELLGDKFYRVGVTQINSNINISFFTSFLSLLTDEYITLMDNEEIIYINKLLDELTSYTNNTDLSSKLKDVTKNILKKYIKDKDPSIWLLELLVNKFEINLLIFDFTDNQIYTVYSSDIMNPWKPFFLFAKSNNNWEPIRNQDKKLFCYNDLIIKKILSSPNIEIKYYNSTIIKKDYFLLDNINEIISTNFSNNLENLEDNETCTDDNIIEDSTEINKTFIKNIVVINENKLKKMTKEEIINYMKEINKNIVHNKKTTKKELIELALAN
jgi:hypothetical protein